MRGFLRALLDCCEQDGESGGFAVPPAALERLSECAGIDREQRDREREARRIRRLIDDLSEPEQDLRLAAIEQLLKRGSAARAAVDTLGRVLDQSGAGTGGEKRGGLALGGIGGGEAATVLLRMVGDGEQPVALRRAAAEALGLCQVPAEREAENRCGGAGAPPARPGTQEERELGADRRGAAPAPGCGAGAAVAAARSLPVLGQEPGRVVPMLT